MTTLYPSSAELNESTDDTDTVYRSSHNKPNNTQSMQHGNKKRRVSPPMNIIEPTDQSITPHHHLQHTGSDRDTYNHSTPHTINDNNHINTTADNSSKKRRGRPLLHKSIIPPINQYQSSNPIDSIQSLHELLSNNNNSNSTAHSSSKSNNSIITHQPTKNIRLDNEMKRLADYTITSTNHSFTHELGIRNARLKTLANIKKTSNIDSGINIINTSDNTIDVYALNKWRKRVLKYVESTIQHESRHTYIHKVSRTGVLYTADIPELLDEKQLIRDKQRASDDGPVQLPLISPYPPWTVLSIDQSRSIHTASYKYIQSLFSESSDELKLRERRSTSISPITYDHNDTSILIAINRCFTRLIYDNIQYYTINQHTMQYYDPCGTQIYCSYIHKKLSEQLQYNDSKHNEFDIFTSIANHNELLNESYKNHSLVLSIHPHNHNTEQSPILIPKLRQYKPSVPPNTSSSDKRGPGRPKTHPNNIITSSHTPSIILSQNTTKKHIVHVVLENDTVQQKLSYLKLTPFVVHHIQ